MKQTLELTKEEYVERYKQEIKRGAEEIGKTIVYPEALEVYDNTITKLCAIEGEMEGKGFSIDPLHTEEMAKLRKGLLDLMVKKNLRVWENT